MSKGPWKPREEPADHRPRGGLLGIIAEKHEELAATELRRAQLNGELALLYRTAARQQHKSDAPAANRRVA